ncbi:MAG: adenylate kinase family enzyme [Saprospiraceae bacterium]|jgi:adenylate kinase family enzyme
MILGCCGAGKSTLARQLHEITKLPLYHLDQYYWKENWTETPIDKWKPIVTELANKEEWIIDGNYGGTYKPRMDRADTIIYLKYNTLQCLYRVTKRILKYHGKVRPDMPDGCRERFDFEFLHYVATYNLIRGKSILKKLNSFETDKRIVVLGSDNEVNRLLKTLGY